MAQRGLWFDGQIALERPVELAPDAKGLVLIDDTGARHPVELADLVRLDSPAGTLRFGHRSCEGWRLLIDEPVEAAIRAVLPRGGSLSEGVSRRAMAALISLSAAASALAAVVIIAPGLLAQHMPMSWERKLGAAYDMPIAAARCEHPRTRAALDALVDRIDPKARSDGFTLDLVQLGVVNAVALPGGRMVLFDGMVDEVDNPDAIAGIVAHEIAHVRRRHVASAMVRQLGLGTVVTLLGGGAVAGNAGNLLSLRFSRGAEAEADSDAIAMLNRAHISPRPTAELFVDLSRDQAEDSGYALEFLQSHPLSRSRAKRFAAAEAKGARYTPALSFEQFRALKTMCRAAESD